jgi:hypothetical protein
VGHSTNKHFNYMYFGEVLEPNFVGLHAKMLEICSRLSITSRGGGVKVFETGINT